MKTSMFAEIPEINNSKLSNNNIFRETDTEEEINGRTKEGTKKKIRRININHLILASEQLKLSLVGISTMSTHAI